MHPTGSASLPFRECKRSFRPNLRSDFRTVDQVLSLHASILRGHVCHSGVISKSQELPEARVINAARLIR